MHKRNENFWINDLKALCNKNNFYSFWPSKENNINKNLNNLSRFIIYACVLISLIKKSIKPLIIGIVALVIIIFIKLFFFKEKFTNVHDCKNEQALGEIYRFLPFSNPKSGIVNPTCKSIEEVKNYPSCKTEENCVKPSEENPMMNPPLYKQEKQNDKNCYFSYDTSPEGEQGACDQFGLNLCEKNIRKEMEKDWSDENNDDFTKKLFKGTSGALWDRVNSQRQFYTVNGDEFPYEKRGEFANWLYGNKYVCKSGSIYMNEACGITPDDSLVCTGNNVSTPTNFGIDK